MIHIATIHWQTDKWIDVQLKYLKLNITGPYKVYAFLNGIERQHYSKFCFVCDEPIEEHGIKLNLLAKFISLQANPSDILLFLDGDAFPIAPLEPYLHNSLSEYPLCAVLRAESLADQQPHPTFCATTVEFWNKLEGDWKMGFCWQDSQGQWITDIGGNLLKRLKNKGIAWKPIYRSHSVGQHSLWYGIYDNLIYHHGAGFRSPLSRVDVANGRFWMHSFNYALSKSRSLQVRMERLWEHVLNRYIAKPQQQEHDVIYERISISEKTFFTNILQKHAQPDSTKD